MTQNKKRDVCVDQGFTIMELILVVMVLAIIAGFAIPNYIESQRLAIEEGMVQNMRTIHGAVEWFRSKEGEYLPTDLTTIAGINDDLSLGIMAEDPNVNYIYDPTSSVAGAAYEIRGEYTPGGGNDFMLKYTPNQVLGAKNPGCCTGSCPSRQKHLNC